MIDQREFQMEGREEEKKDSPSGRKGSLGGEGQNSVREGSESGVVC